MNAPIQLFQEVTAIGQARQRIVPRQRLRACFRRFAFTDFRRQRLVGADKILRTLLDRLFEIITDRIEFEHRLAQRQQVTVHLPFAL